MRNDVWCNGRQEECGQEEGDEQHEEGGGRKGWRGGRAPTERRRGAQHRSFRAFPVSMAVVPMELKLLLLSAPYRLQRDIRKKERRKRYGFLWLGGLGVGQSRRRRAGLVSLACTLDYLLGHKGKWGPLTRFIDSSTLFTRSVLRSREPTQPAHNCRGAAYHRN